ncbi:MAG: DUF308 domain-containing protein [Phycisphaerales bacterium]|nr:DUF308 domain-containing protein [Phycisphaerales bacterium]
METPHASVGSVNPWEIRERLRQARGVVLVEGILLLLCGLFAMVISPFIASTILILILGWMSILSGVVLLARTFMGGSESVLLNLVNALLIGGLGVLFLVWPFESLEIVTLVLAGWCFLRGLMDVFGMPTRSHVAPGLQFIGGIGSIVLAVLLVIWWPRDALWAPGLLFGIQLFFLGLILVATWNALRNGGIEADPPAMATAS